MKDFLNEKEEMTPELLNSAIDSCIEKIIVNDNDLDTESLIFTFIMVNR